MNGRLKKELCDAFAPPPPVRKAELLRRVGAGRISLLRFVLMQLGYMRRTVAVLGAAMLALVLAACTVMQEDAARLLSAFAPFLAVSLPLWEQRSYRCGMEELEHASRFSLKTVMLARLAVLGTVHLMLMGLMLLLCGGGLWERTVRILLPYCTTAAVCLPAVRKFHGSEGGYICAGIAAAVGLFFWMRPYLRLLVLSRPVVVLVLTAELAAMVYESAKTIRKTEELTWSFA